MPTRNCKHCGNEYTRRSSAIGEFCSRKCVTDHRKKDKVAHRRMWYRPAHPLAPPGGYVAEARIVLYAKVGSGIQRCHWCGRSISWSVGLRGTYADHVVADHLDSNHTNDDPANLVAACGPCNGTRSRRVGDDETFAMTKLGTRVRGKYLPCQQCGQTFFRHDYIKAEHGRFCSRGCANKAQWSA